MLIYNAKKEFIGIDEKDLTTLGFNDLSGLKAEANDFADLFVKTPGFIHNFKHVHWIDFITCADSSEDSKVIINVNGKNFKSKITIENLYLTDNASSKAYIIHLNNLRELTKGESENFSGDIAARPVMKETAIAATPVVDEFDTVVEREVEVSNVQVDPYETPLEVDFDEDDHHYIEESAANEEESIAVEAPEESVAVEENLDDMLDVGDLTFDEEEVVSTPKLSEQIEITNEAFDNGYTYDPQVASDELGLPLDLIEEFIQDFIAQAKEFKSGIYEAMDTSEFDQVRILSHKLKGVAANLRIEDAFEVLSIVNTSDDINVVKDNLDTFYKIIAKLAGEEIAVAKPVTTPEVTKASDENEVSIDFKEEEEDKLEIEAPQAVEEVLESDEDDDLYGDLLDVEDSQVPQKIDMPELADDEFVSSDVDLEKLDVELESIEDIELLDLDKEIELDTETAMNMDEGITLDDVEDITLEQESVSEVTYSKENVAAEIGIDLESFNELFEDYVNESRLVLSDMKSAVDTDDIAGCQHEALKLQGMSDNMRVNSFTAELETLTHSTDKDAMTQAIDKIESIISNISRTGA